MEEITGLRVGIIICLIETFCCRESFLVMQPLSIPARISRQPSIWDLQTEAWEEEGAKLAKVVVESIGKI